MSDAIKEIIASCKARTTPNKYIREHSEEYWTDIKQAAQQIREYIDKEIIGEEEPQPTRYGKRIPASRSVISFQKLYRNKLRAEQRQKLR